MSMERAQQIMAEHLAKKAAKKAGTESKQYIAGYTAAVLDLAKMPMPEGAEMIAALDGAIDALPDKPEEDT